MDKIVEFYCDVCGIKWESSIAELKKVIYRGDEKGLKQKPDEIVSEQKAVSEYRSICPGCGKYWIKQVQED